MTITKMTLATGESLGWLRPPRAPSNVPRGFAARAVRSRGSHCYYVQPCAVMVTVELLA